MPEASRRELEKKAITRHYGTILFKRLNGESVEKIAESLKMERATVSRCLAWAEENWSRIISRNGDTGPRPKTPEVAAPSDWKAAEACSGCGTHIAAGKDRLVIAAMELTHKIEDFTTDHREKGKRVEESRGEVVDVVGRHGFRHYCDECSAREPEFLIINPAFVQPEVTPAASRSAQQTREVPETVKSDLAAGDDRSFNETFPEHAPNEGVFPDRAPNKDAMARSTGLEVIGRRSGFGSDSLRVDTQSGEAAQRKRVVEFLNDPRSKTKLRPDVRSAVRTWAEGASQNEVAKKIGIGQPTVSRWIKTAQVMANAPR